MPKTKKIAATTAAKKEPTGDSQLQSQSVTTMSRDSLAVPPGPVGAMMMSKVQSYLSQTGVQATFSNLVQQLFSRQELPYNPYPGLAVRLRPFMEKFYMDSLSDDKIEFVLSVPLRQARLLNLFTIQEGGSFWGLRSLVRVVDTAKVNRYRWLCDNITPHYTDLYQKEGYSNQVMVALVGAAVFHGSFYDQVHIAQFRLEFLITGKQLDEALSMFVNSVMMDVERLRNSKYHILIGLSIPVVSASTEKEDVWMLEFWDPQTVENHKDELMQKISDAVIGNKYILAECVFQLDPFQESYIQGQKQYTFSYIPVLDDLREENLSSFSEFPMASLHEGVFLNQTQAESYLCMYSPQIEMVDNANIKRASAHSAQRLPGIASRKFSAAVEDDYLYIQRHVHQRLQKYQPRKARIDGFQLTDDPGSGPFAWQITGPIKSNLQKRIVGFQPWSQLFDIVYHMILLVLMDRKTTDTPLLIELYKLCHSTAGKLHMVGEKNKAVRALIKGFMERSDGFKVRTAMLDYQKGIKEVLSLRQHERSSDLRAIGQAMSAQVSSVLDVSDKEMGSHSHLNLMELMLKDQYSFMMSTLIRLSEDAVEWCPLFKDQLEQLRSNFPDLISRPASNTRDSKAAGPRDLLPKTAVIKHGFEHEEIIKHENSTLTVANLMEKETSKLIAKESVLLRYVVDTNLAKIWQEFQEETFQGKEPPQNPFPSLVTKLRTCAMRMDLCFEKESTILEQLLTKKARVFDEENFVYHLPDSDSAAYGPVTSVAVLDPTAYGPVTRCVQEFLVNKAYIHRKGPYRIGICLGLTGPCVLYGKMKPYLTQIDLHEHYYIQGPSGCEADAAQLFAVMIQKHVWELVSANQVPILGVFLGRDKVRWSWEEVINKKLGFFTETEMVARRKEPVYLKAYVLFDGWRYVPVVKRFLLHYMQDGDLGTERFFQDDHTNFYSTVFLSAERAAFNYQNGGPVRRGNPLSSSNVSAVLSSMNQKLLHLKKTKDFMETHRLLLLRSLLADHTGHVAEAWRMFHSMAGQAEYVAGIAESLAELVEFELEYAKSVTMEITSTDGLDQEQDQTVRISTSPVNLGVLSAMMKALLDKASIVTEWRIAMCALSMNQLILHKVKGVAEMDRKTGSIYPIIQEMTVTALEEVAHMFHNIKTALGNDVHNMSHNAIKTFKEIHKAETIRPISVESEILSNPQMFLPRPQANYKVLGDEQLYHPRRRKK